MAFFLAPSADARPQFFTSQGAVLAGGFMYWYAATTTTPQDTFTSAAGSVANANPITLDAAGRPPTGIYLTEGLGYKLVVKDSAGNTIFTQDNVVGITTALTNNEWSSSGLTPTYIGATSFSFPGDQTTDAHKQRRLKIVDAVGTKYGTIISSVFSTLTTVTLDVDNGGSLQNPVSSVSWGIITAVNPSISADAISRKADSIASAATTDIWSTAGDSVHVTGNTGPITSFGTAPYAGAMRTVIFDSTPTITHNATTLQCPGGQSVVIQAGDKAFVYADTTANSIILAIERVNQPATQRGVIAAGRNVAARTNSGTPNTKLDITADELQLEDSNGNVFVAKNVSGTIDFGTVGANGIDAGVQVLSTWYYGWVIAKPDGTVAVLGSTSATAPTLPSGYTFKALATAVRSDGSVHFIPYRQKGNWARFEASQSVLSGGTSTTEAIITITAAVPPVALAFDAYAYGLVTGNGGGSVDTFLILRYITGQNFSHGRVAFPSSAGAYAMPHNNAIVPNVSQQLFYIWNNNTNVAALSADAYIRGFQLPMGGE